MIFLSLRISTVTVVTDHVNLLYITDDENSHYILAKGLSSMVLEQYNNDKNKKYLCQYCLHGCTSEEELKNHIERCKLQRAERIKLPEIGDKNGSDKVKSAKTEYELHLPLVIFLKVYLINKTQVRHRRQNPLSPNTNIMYHVEIASSWHAVMDNTLNPPRWILGDDAAEKCLD